MRQKQEGPFGPEGSNGPEDACSFLAGNGTRFTKASPTRQPRRPPSTSGLSRAICDALADIPREDHGDIMRWLASRGLIGLAHERGFEAAADAAYRYADTLAGGVR